MATVHFQALNKGRFAMLNGPWSSRVAAIVAVVLGIAGAAAGIAEFLFLLA